MNHSTAHPHPFQIVRLVASFNRASNLIKNIIQGLKSYDPSIVSLEFESGESIGFIYERLTNTFQFTLMTEQEGTSISLSVPHNDNSKNVTLRREYPNKPSITVAFNTPECPQRRELETLMVNTQQRLSAMTRDI